MALSTCLLVPLIFIASTRVILVQAACGDLPSPKPCVVDAAANCASCLGGELVPNPFDCNSYYVCKSASEFYSGDPFYCPDGETFDQVSLQCAADGKCTSNCEVTGGGECRYTCGTDTEGKIADPYDCNVYYKCDAAEPRPAETCSDSTPYFNGDNCVKEGSECCHCRPYCYEGDEGLLVEDPTDCRKYFLCLAADQIPTIEGRCKDGEHFDAHAGHCSSTAPCVTLCRNVVDENGCIEPYTCQETGFFPVCQTQCLPDYYRCTEVSDDYAVKDTCLNGLVFSPDTLTCVKNETCPYNR